MAPGERFQTTFGNLQIGDRFVTTEDSRKVFRPELNEDVTDERRIFVKKFDNSQPRVWNSESEAEGMLQHWRDDDPVFRLPPVLN